MPVNLQNTLIQYGNILFAGKAQDGQGAHYQVGRIPNRCVLDFGIVPKGERKGMQLAENGINVPCILKAVHAPAPNETNDTLLLELHDRIDQGVRARFSLQYIPHNLMPYDYPELVLLPENVVYVQPAQISRVLITLEPVNLMQHGTKIIGEAGTPERE